MINFSQQIANHLRKVYFGGNWSDSNLKDNLEGLTWQQATTAIYKLNTIATLAFHVNYYVAGVAKVLEGGALAIRDKYSFDHPPIHSQEDWEKMLQQIWADGEHFAQLIEKMPESQLREIFTDEKYGTFHQNLLGIIEHLHYHIGQIALIRKIILSKDVLEKS